MTLLTKIVQLSALYAKCRLRLRVLRTKSKQLPLLSLPPELIISISSHLTTPDLFVLTRANKQFHELLTPLLYQRAAHEIRPSITTRFQWDPTPERSILHFAAAHGNAKLLRGILQRSKEAIDTADPFGMTPLTSAVAWGHTNTVKLLLEAGANTERRCSTHGWTALHLAAVSCNVEIARLLVRFCADNGARDLLGGYTPAHLVVCNSEFWPVCGELLMVLEGEMGTVDDSGDTVEELKRLTGWVRRLQSSPQEDPTPRLYNSEAVGRGFAAMFSLSRSYRIILGYENDRCRWCARAVPWRNLTEASKCKQMYVLKAKARGRARWKMSGCEESWRSK